MGGRVIIPTGYHMRGRVVIPGRHMQLHVIVVVVEGRDAWTAGDK